MKFEVIVSSILKVILVVAGIYFCNTSFIVLKKQQLRNQAVSECLQFSGTYEFTDVGQNVKSSAPQKDIYRICLADKGYTSTW